MPSAVARPISSLVFVLFLCFFLCIRSVSGERCVMRCGVDRRRCGVVSVPCRSVLFRAVPCHSAPSASHVVRRALPRCRDGGCRMPDADAVSLPSSLCFRIPNKNSIQNCRLLCCRCCPHHAMPCHCHLSGRPSFVHDSALPLLACVRRPERLVGSSVVWSFGRTTKC